MRERATLYGLTLLLVLALALALQSWVRRAIAPSVLYTWWVVRLLLASIPQALIWFAFLAVALFFAGRSLIVWEGMLEETSEPERHRRGPVETWWRRIDLAVKGDYSRWRLAQYLGDLTLSALAHQEGLTSEEVRERLGSGDLDAPPRVRAYLRAALGARSYSTFSELRRRFRAEDGPSPSLADLGEVIEFLEDQLEVHRER